MIDLELELVSENPSWIAVLKAYQKAQEALAAQQAEAAAKSAQAEKSAISSDLDSDPELTLDESGTSNPNADSEVAKADGFKKRATRWVQRITKLPGIEAAELSKVHGRLIAYDLLKCDLAGRSDGMVYQLTSSGKSVLDRVGNEAKEADDRSAA